MIDLRLTPSQRRQVSARLRATHDASYGRRLMAILALDEGEPVSEVAERLGVTRQSVYNWARAFETAGDATALEDRYGGGRPSAWAGGLEGLLLAALRQRPDQLGYPGANGTIRLLQEYLERCSGRRLSDDTIRRRMRRLDYVWKRSRYVLPPDPEREKKTRHPAEGAKPAAAERAPG
jgi:transposase